MPCLSQPRTFACWASAIFAPLLALIAVFPAFASQISATATGLAPLPASAALQEALNRTKPERSRVCVNAGHAGTCMARPLAIGLGLYELEIVVPGGTSVLPELKVLGAESRLSGLLGCSGQACQHASSKVATMEVQKVKSFRFGQLLAMIVNTTHNVLSLTAQMRERNADLHRAQPDHGPDVHAMPMPLNPKEILDDLTITVRGQTMELLDFVRVYFDSVDEFIDCVDVCAELAECEIDNHRPQEDDDPEQA